MSLPGFEPSGTVTKTVDIFLHKLSKHSSSTGRSGEAKFQWASFFLENQENLALLQYQLPVPFTTQREPGPNNLEVNC